MANKHINKNRIKRAKDKADATYSFSDFKTQNKLLKEVHKITKARAEYTGITHTVWDLDKALAALKARIDKFLGIGAKYKPHQGKQEIARRKKQIAAGILKLE